MDAMNLSSRESSILNTKETFSSSFESKYVAFASYGFCFSAGLGIEFPWVHLAGNLGIFDLIFLSILFISRNNYNFFSWASLFPILIGFIALISLTYNVFFSAYYLVGFDGFFVVMRWFYYAFVVSVFAHYINNERALYSCLKWLLFGGLALLTYAWLNWQMSPKYFFGFPVLSWIQELNSNTLGFYFTLLLPLAIFLTQIRFLNRFIGVILCLILSTSALLTTSKSAALITASVLCIYMIRSKTGLFFLVSLFGGLVYFFSEIFISRWDASQTSNNDRINLIQQGVNMGSENLFIGIGPKGYDQYFNNLLTSDAHNAYVNIFAELGFFAIFIFFIMYAYVLINLLSAKSNINNNLISYIIVTIAVLIMNGMISGLTYSDKIPWIIIGLSMACVNFSQRSIKNKPTKLTINEI